MILQDCRTAQSKQAASSQAVALASSVVCSCAHHAACGCTWCRCRSAGWHSPASLLLCQPLWLTRCYCWPVLLPCTSALPDCSVLHGLLTSLLLSMLPCCADPAAASGLGQSSAASAADPADLLMASSRSADNTITRSSSTSLKVCTPYNDDCQVGLFIAVPADMSHASMTEHRAQLHVQLTRVMLGNTCLLRHLLYVKIYSDH
jgi:hypothetical protein